ncbi:MAG TPA: hypothetical protein VHB48_10950 [Chitinophagaceae bacterium]|jgi:hypothetical protein|nr:hypothetical protein [Chitinophagaceae bacterium]
MKKKFRAVKAVGILLIVSAVFTLLSFIVMLLWNNVLAAVVHVGVVTFWQAAGLLLLSKILFGFGGKPFRKHHNPAEHAWRKQMISKWQNMSPEERKNFKEEFRQRCRGGWYGNRGWKDEFNRHEEKTEEV